MTQHEHLTTRGLQRHRPEHVDAFASTVISVLRDRQVVCSDGVRQFVLEHLVRAILVRGEFDPRLVMEELRGHRLSIDKIIDLYIPKAACVLGQSWVDDDVSFADVTIGAMRLQSLLGEASSQGDLDFAADDRRLHALVVLPQCQQHFLGVSVVAAQLRRIGCEVTQSFDEPLGALNARLMEERPDLILISCARLETLETVSETVQTIRATLSTGPVIALGGGVLDEVENLKERTGVDIVTNDAKDVVSFCSRRNKTLRRL
ncbi:cobalamin B12-binding domain-containing protein [Roseobacter sp. YSTF-M11]|uniref:Cobalamin B12-binding domain-containing protein n=1 Tax=Roseobacter insulae TaxID=2859783 RepID=A0A9X1K0L2_9RHOB|nr:cobalamin B12-binding domain-containing protein [Roseobacter insulae]MBW4708284.1 cobalamin B12-binding domain-containing protein [Roseobacter insulae]